MATAEKVFPTRDFNVQLTLSAEEAETLKYVVGGIGGTNRGRTITSAIYDALDGIGLRSRPPAGTELPVNQWRGG